MDNFTSFLTNFGFIYPQWLLALIPLAFVLPWLAEKTNHTGLIAPHLNALLTNKENQYSNKPKWAVATLGFAWLTTVIALAGPSWEARELPAMSLSGARVVVMDMSRSMYAVDIPPNRLSQARYKTLDMLPGWDEGSTGLVAYAGDAYTVSPLTEDANTLSNLIPNLSPDIMPFSGSNVAAGLQQAIDLLKQANVQQGDIILVTDGISEQEKDDALDLLKKENYRVSVLAIGTQEGAPIELPQGGMVEQNGNLVIAKLDLNTLSAITEETGGLLQPWQPTDTDVDNIVAFTKVPISDGEGKTSKKDINERVNAGFWLLLPLTLLALLGFRRGILLAAMLTIMPMPPAQASAFKNDNQEGADLFKSGDFDQAAKRFTSPQWKGAAQYEAGDYEGAIKTLSPLTDANSRYNLGNAYAQSGDLKQAQLIYEALLKAHPDFDAAKKNLEIVKQAQDQKQQQQKQQQNQNSDEQSDQNKQDQEQTENNQKNNPQNKDENKTKNEEGQDQQGNKGNNREKEDQNQQQNKGDNEANQQDQQNSSSSTQNEDTNADKDQQDKRNAAKENDKKDAQDASSLNENNTEKQQDGQENSQQGLPKDQGEKNEDNTENSLSPASTNGEKADEGKQLNAAHPVLKKLEQVPDSTAELIRAQLILQSQQKAKPKQTENSW